MRRILGKASSINVRKVLWTCAELNLNYTREDYGSGFQSVETDAFRTLNPNAMVPVLIENDFVLWESNSICRYLARGSDLLPSEPQACGRVEQWMDWQATELNNSWRYAFMALVRKSSAHQDEALITAGISNWNKHIGIIDQQLAKTEAFIAGDDFTLADVVLGLSVSRWLMAPFDKPDLKHVMDYEKRLSERPAFLLYGKQP